MYGRLIAGVLMLGLAMSILLAQEKSAQSPVSRLNGHPPEASQSSTLTEKTFDQLMDDAMSRMQKGMSNSMSTGGPDREFVTMMIPHHQGAIDMAKALLLYGKDEQLRRLAQRIITDQQKEVQVMELWLAKHPEAAKGRHPMEMRK